MTNHLPIGTVSHATMRPEDLIPAFLEALDNAKESFSFDRDVPLRERSQRISDLDNEMGNIERRMETDGYFDWDESHDDQCQDDLAWLFDRLGEFAPPHCYFGAHEGDSSDYGCWPSWDSIDDSIHDGEMLKVDDLADIPDDYSGEILHVNDHGNATLYTSDSGKQEEVWAIV